jgi:hypothetical protein
MKKIGMVLGILVILTGTYTGYNLILQNKADKQFICDCRNSKNISGTLFLELYHDAGQVRNMKIKLNQDDIPLDSTKIYGDKKPFTYAYERRFNADDTVTINIANKAYRICGFKNDTVIINAKKGLECRLKSAKINGVSQNENHYKLF